MSFVTRNAERARQATARAVVTFRNLIRRMAITASNGGLWQLMGPNDEVMADVEVFQGVGFASRPEADSDSAEAIVVKVGGKLNHPVIVATRDEDVRVDVAEDETAIFNSVSIVHVRANGEIEATSIGGTPVALATKADIDALEEFLKDQFDSVSGVGHVHATPSGPTTTMTAGSGSGTGFSVPSASGTTKMKAE